MLPGNFKLRWLPWTVLALASCTESNATNGDDIQQYLVDRNAVSGYLSNILSPIIDDLGNGNIQLNREYQPSLVNVYVVRTGNLDPTRLQKLGIPDIGSAVALERNSLILIDEAHIKELVTLAYLFWENEWSMARSMAEMQLRGLASLGQLWDPNRNRAISGDEIENWRIAVRGALAFLVAHEVGHIVIGNTDPQQIRTAHIFTSRREQDIHWACPDLIDERATTHRAIEANADDFALRLLDSVTRGASYSKYEVGAEWYFSVLLERNLIDALGRIENLDSKPDLKALLQRRYGQRFQALLSQRQQHERTRRGVVAAFFPKSHPDTLSRLIASSDVDQRTVYLMKAWSERLRKDCASLRYR